MSEQTIIPMSIDDAKDFLIATAVKDFGITAWWLRRHVDGDETATHSALIAVADALDSATIEYKAPEVVETYRAMQHLYHLVTGYFNSDPRDYTHDRALDESNVRKQLEIVGTLLYGKKP